MAILDLHLSNPHDLLQRLCRSRKEAPRPERRLGDYDRSAS